MRMVSAIDVNWVSALLPNLKDPVDVDRLSGKRALQNSQPPEEAKQTLLGKRKANTHVKNVL